MLFYKAWRESRLGFLLSVLALTVVCWMYWTFPRYDPRFTYLQDTYLVTYRGAIRNIFIVLTLFLGLGGFLRERSYGTLGFTLALPISRFRLVITRAAVGVVEMALLALVPAMLSLIRSAWLHQGYPSLSQALVFSAVWIGCGIMFLAVGLLISSVVPGDYPAATACLMSLFAYLMLLDQGLFERFPSFDLFNVMSGDSMPYFSGRDTCELTYLPWRTLFIIALLACSVLAAAWQVVERRDF